jgi:hypothetical protein
MKILGGISPSSYILISDFRYLKQANLQETNKLDACHFNTAEI